MNEQIRVLIADDHTIVRSGVRLLLEAEADITVVGEALNGSEVLAMAETSKPDVILMDIAMPGMDGLEATRQIRERWPEIKILVLTMHRSDAYFFEMLKNGASGYVLKGADPGELIKAVRVVGQGEVYLHPSVAQKLLKDYLDRVGEANEGDPQLSPREREILKLIAEGYTNKEIADKLVISPSTVYTHRGNLMEKLALNNRRELIQYARKKGYIKDY